VRSTLRPFASAARQRRVTSSCRNVAGVRAIGGYAASNGLEASEALRIGPLIFV
jgi:hypothetical protein